MRLYELMFITRPDLDEEKVSGITGRYQDIITSAGGQVKRHDKWGKRRLAYEIEGQREGVYVLLTFESDPAVTKEIDRLMKLDGDILRHIIVRASPSSLQVPEHKPRKGRMRASPGGQERPEGGESGKRLVRESGGSESPGEEGERPPSN